MSLPAGPDDDLFPVLRAADIVGEPVSQRWLVEGLWSDPAVGVIGGQPKSGKSWLALELAVSVATGKACLARYPVPRPGPALVYLAEDSLAAVRERLEALAHWRGVAIEALDIHVITTTTMRLDLARDQVRLLKTARALSPRLLVLDPLVRLHRLDENSANEVSGLLAYLRRLQRELDLSIVLVHHTRKNAPARQQAGQGLRGSGDIHAWSDSSLYLRRQRADLTLSVEHRSASAPEPVSLRLVTGSSSPHLEILTSQPQGEDDLEKKLLALLNGQAPLTRCELRRRLGVKNERLGTLLQQLEASGIVERTPSGWRRAPPP